MAVPAAADINQGVLEKVVHELFVGEKIHSNVRKGADIRNQLSGNFLELDVWIPNLNLCFEFQDPYHYISVWDSQQPVAKVWQKDNLKHRILRERNETLVIVPCWWDGSKKSLWDSVCFHRPDLAWVPKEADSMDYSIPFNPPSNFYSGGLPGVGMIMLASFPTSVEFKVSISAKKTWWLGEKYDGVRVCWNSAKNLLYSRAGAEMELPESFENKVTEIRCFFDAELWFGRGFYLCSQQVLIGSAHEVDFSILRLVAFDEPSYKMQSEEFETRYARLISSIPSSHQFVLMAPRLLVNSKKQVKMLVQVILDDGGEGVILRKPTSKYIHGRSSDLVKLKASRGDKEGMVVELKGEQALIKLPDGTTFLVHASQWRELKLKVGDIVTFTFDSYSIYSIPTNPVITRIRSDLSWEDIVREHHSSSRQSQFLNDDSKQVFGAGPKARGYWLSHGGRNMRLALEKFAGSRKFDPLKASNWYSFCSEDMKKLQGTKAMLRAFKGNYMNALIALFPEVNFERSKFASVQSKEYQRMRNRRLFFERFAKRQGFDPLVPTNWYKVKLETLLEVDKDIKKVIYYHRNSHITALIDLFPDIEIYNYMFSHVPDKYWHNRANQRDFAVRIARESGFDPLVPENWYTVSKKTFIDYKGGGSFLQIFDGSKVKALQSIFPDIGLDPRKFQNFTKNYFSNIKHRRHFFEDYARRNKFDPLSPYAWYPISLASVSLSKGGRSVLRPYKGSLTAALQHLFPDVSFDLRKFMNIHPREQFSTAQSRRDFFTSFAAAHQFNPLVPQAWYQNPISYWLRKTNNATTVCSYYNGNYVRALLHLFPEIGLKPIEFHRAREQKKLGKLYTM